MRLINTKTYVLEDFAARPKPKYAVLSHRWGADEITFSAVSSGDARAVGDKLVAHTKIGGLIQRARRDGLEYVWVDTCCIDKSSSAELSEAINSMYSWYKGSACCYVYLHDVGDGDRSAPFGDSGWFSRGWTLQELLAPRVAYFYDRRWSFVGDKVSLGERISRVTGIDHDALRNGDLTGYSVAQKMSWSARRVTTRLEDAAYCLLGLFDINMPLLYGEGRKAFLRLQEEIIKDRDDHSILAWDMGSTRVSSLLAPSPDCFADCGDVTSIKSPEGRQPFQMTNRGLSITLEITPWAADTYLAYLACSRPARDVSSFSASRRAGIFVRRLTENDQYARVTDSVDGRSIALLDLGHFHQDRLRPRLEKQLFIRKAVDVIGEERRLKDSTYGYRVPVQLPRSFNIFTVHKPSDGSLATLPHGRWGHVMTVDVSSERKGLKTILLGFDFDFNPLCMLMTFPVKKDNLKSERETWLIWFKDFPSKTKWKETKKGSALFRRTDNLGVWALQGHRLYGLDVFLPDPGTRSNGTSVTLDRDEGLSNPVWKFDIDRIGSQFSSDMDQGAQIVIVHRRTNAQYVT